MSDSTPDAAFEAGSRSNSERKIHLINHHFQATMIARHPIRSMIRLVRETRVNWSLLATIAEFARSKLFVIELQFTKLFRLSVQERCLVIFV